MFDNCTVCCVISLSTYLTILYGGCSVSPLGLSPCTDGAVGSFQVGQRIRKIEEGSAAEISGLLVGDRIICVNGHNVEKESHQDVVKRIKERENETELLVVDEQTEKFLKVSSSCMCLYLGLWF